MPARLPVALLATILAAALVAGCAQPRDPAHAASGSLDRPGYAPAGTQITLLNAINGTISETRITAGSATGPRGAFVRGDGTPGVFYPGCWGCGAGTAIEEDRYLALWPLETGRHVAFERTAANGQRARVVIRVAGSERVTTPAGTFDAWLLDGRVEHLDGIRYSAQIRVWWAPGPGWVVRAEGGDSQGNTVSSRVVAFVPP